MSESGETENCHHAAAGSLSPEALTDGVRVLGDPEHGLTVGEIAELLNLQRNTVKIYLRDEKRRVDLCQRIFEQDDNVKNAAIRILEARRSADRTGG